MIDHLIKVSNTHKRLSYPQERDVYASESVDQVMFFVVGAAFI